MDAREFKGNLTWKSYGNGVWAGVYETPSKYMPIADQIKNGVLSYFVGDPSDNK